jgi:hypothetical protein
LLRKHRSEVIAPTIAKHHGRTVKLMGDGLLAEFSSVVEGVDCAAEIQRAMAARNAGQGSRQMAFRIGVHLGDVIVEGDDLYGDGVNIAARLEGIAEHGGICISRQAYDQVQKKLALGYRSLGPQMLKNIPDPVEAYAIQGDGLATSNDRQEIGYCRTADGVRLAYAISGQGPSLVKTGNWLNHLEYDWDSPIWRHLFIGLSEHQFPAAVEDACAATAWIAAHTAELNIDPTRLAVAGDSAGGTLAAVVCQSARDFGFKIALQVLLCPVTVIEADYEALTGLTRLAGELGLAVVVVHHTRKMASDDLMETVSGTYGISGAADADTESSIKDCIESLICCLGAKMKADRPRLRQIAHSSEACCTSIGRR